MRSHSYSALRLLKLEGKNTLINTKFIEAKFR